MPETLYRGRRAHSVTNDRLRVTLAVEGGHIAELVHLASGVNPLWSPPWPTIEPSAYDPSIHPEYGSDSESRLLSGILGHNLCLDLFGPPSAEEAAAGMTVHGEAAVARYEVSSTEREIIARCQLPMAQLAFERRIQIKDADDTVYISETVENLSALDRPIAWTQHVTLGPPFLERGTTEFRTAVTQSLTLESSTADSSYISHLLDPDREEASFLAWSPASKVLIGYAWRRSDFPWLGVWEENRSRQSPPWNGVTVTRGMEFGVSPVPESRRKMIDRREMFGTPAYRWLPARGKATVEYRAFARREDRLPEGRGSA